MRGGLITAVLAVFGVIVMVVVFPSFMSGVEDTQTNTQTDTFNVTTAAGVTNSTVTLSQPLWNSDTQNVDTLSSDGGGGDNPVASSYTAPSRGLLVTGLDASKTRNLTATYKTDALEDYQGIGEGLPVLPAIGFFAVLAIAIGAIWRVFH